MKNDILELLKIDPGQRTLGELLQDRVTAIYEIVKLRSELERSRIGNSNARHAMLAAGEAEVKLNALPFGTGSLLRLSDVCRLLSLSRSGIYRRVAEGTFPKPIKIGDRAVRWRAEVITAWLDTREENCSSKLV